VPASRATLRSAACRRQRRGGLIDIKDPANPKRLDAVADPLYAYWHGATFSNDGKTVVFTDEWGGGANPRCRATDDLTWGGNSIYDIVRGKPVFRSYYVIPPVQTDQENGVSHISSLVPRPRHLRAGVVPGGASLGDFSDSSNPVEIAYYDRGPIHPTTMMHGGLCRPTVTTVRLSANEIAAAREVPLAALNVQRQDRIRGSRASPW
jgi:hypothetical protein